jgi:AraC-like DNA-binding protein
MNRVDLKSLGLLPTATGAIARLAYTHARRGGVKIKSLLNSAGLTEQQIQDREFRFPVRRQIAFLNATAKALADDLLGFHLAQLPDLRELGMLYYVAASSETLGDALQRTSRYSSIANEGLALKCFTQGAVRIVFEYVGVARHTDRHQMEFLMTVLTRLCRQLTGKPLAPSHVRIAHRRNSDGFAELAAFFGRNITFGAKADELTFIGEVKDMTLTGTDPYLNMLLVAQCERALSHRRVTHGPFRAAVENAIVPLLPHGKVRASQIAAKLGLSQRTSARRLAAEGATFTAILERLRKDLAVQYLSDPHLTISRIAWLLGYQEVSAFTHAYKRWSGNAPRIDRAKYVRHRAQR